MEWTGAERRWSTANGLGQVKGKSNGKRGLGEAEEVMAVPDVTVCVWEWWVRAGPTAAL